MSMAADPACADMPGQPSVSGAPAVAVSMPLQAAARPLSVLSAGSFRTPLLALAQTFGAERLALRFGPAGLLRQDIEQGAPCDLFISASPVHVDRLAATSAEPGTSAGSAETCALARPGQGRVLQRACIATNQLCLTLLARPEQAGRSAQALLLDDRLRLATSTPGDDPGGDYAWQVFARIEASHPGQGARLMRRALPLVGGRHSAPVPPGQMAAPWLLLQGRADLFLGYAHGARQLQADGRFFCLFLPPEWAVTAQYVAAQLTPAAQDFMQFLCSAQARHIMTAAGFGAADA